MSFCANCGSQCVGGDVVSCGLCTQNFHSKCAKLNSACLKALKSNENILFKCDACCCVPISSCLAKLENALCSLNEIQFALRGKIARDLKIL